MEYNEGDWVVFLKDNLQSNNIDKYTVTEIMNKRRNGIQVRYKGMVNAVTGEYSEAEYIIPFTTKEEAERFAGLIAGVKLLKEGDEVKLGEFTGYVRYTSGNYVTKSNRRCYIHLEMGGIIFDTYQIKGDFKSFPFNVSIGAFPELDSLAHLSLYVSMLKEEIFRAVKDGENKNLKGRKYKYPLGEIDVRLTSLGRVYNYYEGDKIPELLIKHGHVLPHVNSNFEIVDYYEDYYIVRYTDKNNQLIQLGFKEESLSPVKKDEYLNQDIMDAQLMAVENKDSKLDKPLRIVTDVVETVKVKNPVLLQVRKVNKL